MGIFETAEGGARLTCIETVNAKHWWMRPPLSPELPEAAAEAVSGRFAAELQK